MARERRIHKEIASWENYSDILFRLVEDDMNQWEAIFIGPENSLYENGVYHFTLRFCRLYPFKPPRTRPTTTILHPAICSHGCHICVRGGPRLEGDWSPAYTMPAFLAGVRNMLRDEAHDEFELKSDVALRTLFKKDKLKYGRYIREHVIKNNVPSTGYKNIHGFSYEDLYKVKGVPSLQFQCRKKIRYTIKMKNPWDITGDIETLPMPKKLKEYLQ